MIARRRSAAAEASEEEKIADRKKSGKKRSDEVPAAKKVEAKEAEVAEPGSVEHAGKGKEAPRLPDGKSYPCPRRSTRRS